MEEHHRQQHERAKGPPVRRPVTPVTRPVSPTTSQTTSNTSTNTSNAPKTAPRLSTLMQPVLSQPSRLRNVCILAHVDHGKTTLTDSLVASNGIISARQAGKLRYLDSRDDEQERGITMESSAISLLYDYRQRACTCTCSSTGSACSNSTTGTSTCASTCAPNSTSNGTVRYCVNLIDSPGHVDFAGHVVTASRLCDGAVVVVDVVEGVCTQTMAVLRQAYSERLQVCLVVNKMDRLVGELAMDCQEAARCIFRVVEQVNAVWGGLDKQHSGACFDPVGKGNVVFASATDGWAFTLADFAKIYTERLQCDHNTIVGGLWAIDRHFDPKTRQFIKHNPDGKQRCAFAQLCLHNIWSIYNHQTTDQVQQICKALRIDLTERDLKADQRILARHVMSSWLPLANCLFKVIIDCLPAPLAVTVSSRLHDLIPTDTCHWTDVLTHHTVGQVAKMFAITRPPHTADGNEHHQRGEMLVGMGRLFSGHLMVGQDVYILSPKYDPQRREPGTFHRHTVTSLFLLMGREVESVQQVHVGCVFGIGGCERIIFKQATLSTSLEVVPLTRPSGSAAAIPLLLKVAIHPRDIQDLPAVQAGLQTLCQADPVAETFVQASSGEQVLAVAGELHLEMCVKDLRERFTDNVDIVVSKPLVPFRETVLVGKRNVMAGMFEEVVCDVCVVDEATGLLSINFGYLSVTLSVHNTDTIDHDDDDDDQRDTLELCVQSSCRLLLAHRDTIIDKTLISSMQTGFRMAMEAGPLCGEPMANVSVVLRAVSMAIECCDLAEASGRLITDFCNGCHAALLYWSPRLLLAVYRCDIQTTADCLGRVYGVLSKRRGTVSAEDYDDTTNLFTVHACLPVVESFGFGDDLRSRTSGVAVPQLLFDGFRLLDTDPLTVDTASATDGDGDTAAGEGDTNGTDTSGNDAMRYLMEIRERKGLYVERRIVECADKQRTRRR